MLKYIKSESRVLKTHSSDWLVDLLGRMRLTESRSSQIPLLISKASFYFAATDANRCICIWL